MGSTETSTVFADRANDAATGASTRRDDIVEAARELYEERGLSRTTVKDITQRVGVTRSLFYHYFSDKDAVTEAVLDDIVEDFLEALRYWNAGRERGNVDKALTDCLRIFRNGIFESGSFRRSLANTENSALYLHFVQTVADRVARYIVDSTVRDFERFHNVEIEHVYETFYMMIVGMTGLIRANPQISDDVVKRIVAQTLHIEGYLDGGAQGAGFAGTGAGTAHAGTSTRTSTSTRASGSNGTRRADERGTRPRAHS